MADEEEVKYCNNCKRDIAAGNFLMHEIHCHRNIVLCEHCDEPIPRSEQEEHFEEYHASVECTLCKTSVEKENMESHMENDCPQRKQHCVYCELEFAQCELRNHLDFCGTRTERCSRCQRYIMLKDQVQHEQIDCTIQATPSPVLHEPRSGLNNQQQQQRMSSFEMDEISRMLDDPSILPSTLRGRRPNLSRPNNMRSQNRAGGPSHISTHNNIYGTSRRRQGQRKTTNQKETTNSERDRTVTKSGSGRNDYGHNLDMDHLLAMHLHGDLNDTELGAQGPGSTENYQASDDQSPDDIILPCEFCDELLSAGELIQHQVVCNRAGLGASTYGLDVPTSEDLPNNSPQRPVPSSTTRAQPHIVDNLAQLAAHDRLSNFEPSDYRFDDDLDEEAIMLPCEFCDILLPGDTLIQHQAICDRNIDRTPRTRSPATRNNTRTKTRGARANPNYRVTNNLARAARHQEDPYEYPGPPHHSNQGNSPSQRLLSRGQYSAQSMSPSGPRSRQNFLRDVEDDAAASYSRTTRTRNERQHNDPRPPPGRMKNINTGTNYRGRNNNTVTRSSYTNRTNDHSLNGTRVHGSMYRNKARQRGHQQTLSDDGVSPDQRLSSRGSWDSNNSRGEVLGGRGATRPKRSAPRGRRHPQGEI